ncbi:hypothetical protein [Exiguobacterium antarcticum]|uniref:hypothetical protein n=1 Tax=Exiguobacterium antarcticum TaxID=132920 RepID=UPI001F2B2F90|nr:hypothetical protein [Exiguobacterium antarcticum]
MPRRRSKGISSSIRSSSSYSNGETAYQTQIIGATILNRIGASFDVGCFSLDG